MTICATVEVDVTARRREVESLFIVTIRSPDVQQQVVAQVFLLWLLVASIVLWRLGPRPRTATGT